jgi:hypothetical protein
MPRDAWPARNQLLESLEVTTLTPDDQQFVKNSVRCLCHKNTLQSLGSTVGSINLDKLQHILLNSSPLGLDSDLPSLGQREQPVEERPFACFTVCHWLRQCGISCRRRYWTALAKPVAHFQWPAKSKYVWPRKQKPARCRWLRLRAGCFPKWAEAESNRRHLDFQSRRVPVVNRRQTGLT